MVLDKGDNHSIHELMEIIELSTSSSDSSSNIYTQGETIIYTDDNKLTTKDMSFEDIMTSMMGAVCIDIQSFRLCDKIVFENINELSTCERFYAVNFKLNRIPSLPNCIECIISNNRISVLPYLPNVEFLNCQYNYIEQIECLPNCHFLVCQHNHIHCIQDLPECVSLYANHNCLSVINVPSCSTLVVDNNLLEHIVESCHYEKVSLHHNPLKRLPKGNYTLMRELNNYERKDDNICIVSNHQLYYTKWEAEMYGIPYPSPYHSFQMNKLWKNAIRLVRTHILTMSVLIQYGIPSDVQSDICQFIFDNDFHINCWRTLHIDNHVLKFYSSKNI